LRLDGGFHRLHADTRNCWLAAPRLNFSFTFFAQRWTHEKANREIRQAAARVFLHQIFALVTPIFFQVVVDKVLTHKGYSTLYVLVAGLVLIGLFDAVLQYLRLTGQERADVLKLAHARDRLARSPRLK
jgi:ABC-type bacteriocin/lantibiotic exporter with double-glycine peptidase domain